jgi:hypothetical protein
MRNAMIIGIAISDGSVATLKMNRFRPFAVSMRSDSPASSSSGRRIRSAIRGMAASATSAAAVLIAGARPR